MRKRFIAIVAGFAFAMVALSWGVYELTRSGDVVGVGASVSVSDALSVAGGEFEFALGPRGFDFPQDHGPHPEYALEWWYYTGNLETGEGRRFGYEVTFFRRGLRATAVERSSDWGVEQIYFAHFALSDIENDEFYAFERYSRDAIGLAGAQASPFRVWVENWEVSGLDGGTLPMRLRAKDGGVEVDLVLDSEKRIVLHGDGGFARKGRGEGEASYYYSMTRMPTMGIVSLDGRSHRVSGSSWMDREWSSAQLSDEYVGWDWFALQLSDGLDVMRYWLRPRDGAGSGFGLGTLVGSDGSYLSLAAEDVSVEVLDRWESSLGGTYPSRWRLEIPKEGLDIEIVPYMDDQELDTLVRYWEGAVRVEGLSRGQPVSGRGYVELTGYAE